MLKFLIKMLSNFNPQPSQRLTSNIKEVTFDNIELQIQDDTGNWRTCHVTLNESQRIISGMRQLSEQYPNKRIRAVDSNRRIVDIL